MHQPTCSFVSASSDRTTDIKGAMPNQAKKHRKNAIHAMWNARICGVENLKSEMRVALAEESICGRPRTKGFDEPVNRLPPPPATFYEGPLQSNGCARGSLRRCFFGKPK